MWRIRVILMDTRGKLRKKWTVFVGRRRSFLKQSEKLRVFSSQSDEIKAKGKRKGPVSLPLPCFCVTLQSK